MVATLVDNLFRSAREFATRCALVAGDQRVTYQDLVGRAAAFGACLQRGGLNEGDRVALLLANSIEFVVAYYGTLLVGGIAVPLNVAAKARDLLVWLNHCEATWLVADTANPDVQSAIANVPRLKIVHASDAVARTSVQATMNELGRDDAKLRPLTEQAPAAILYTSGTSGRPKAVVLSHRNLAANTAAIVDYLHLTETDSIPALLPFHYSYGSSVLHTHLQAGGTLVLETGLVFPHRLLEVMARERVTGLAGVPSTFALLLSRVSFHEYGLASLRYVTQAGGAAPRVLFQKLQSALPHVQIYAMYGQTEATARLTYLAPERLAEKPSSVGRAIPGVQLSIRHEDGSAAGVGEIGEICASGPNIMLGYWNDPAATAAVLRDGWLHTGDMGHVDVEGDLFIVGRRGDMIKTGAHRVHPLDIEEVIAELPAVAESAVVAVDDEILGEAIKAFVVPMPGAHINPTEVKAHCRARLANYKVPKCVEVVASLPKTSSGKLSRRELREREHRDGTKQTPVVASTGA